jgi:hypothetical protein
MVAVPKPSLVTSAKPSADPFTLISSLFIYKKDEKRLIIHQIESFNQELNMNKKLSA